MFRLTTLGTIGVRRTDGGDALQAGSKGLAILAYLALREGEAVRRDKLLAVFWPYATADSARASLRSSIYRINRAADEPIITTASADSVRIVCESLTCDATDFARAVAEDKYAEAMSLYGGELLPGLHIRGSSAFNDWLDRERSRFVAMAAEASWKLAGASVAADPAEAVRWARRAVALEPLDEGVARRFLRLMATLGDRAGLVAGFNEFSDRIEAELGLEPSAETVELLARLKAGLDEGLPPPSRVSTEHLRPEGEIDSSELISTEPRRGAWKAMSRWWALAGIVVIAGLLYVVPNREAAAKPPVVAVLPFSFSGDPALSYLGTGVTDILGRRLEQEGVPVRIIRGEAVGETGASAAARSSKGAAYVVTGSVVAIRRDLEIRATLLSSSGGRPVAEVERSGDIDEAFRLIDRLAAPIVSAAWGGSDLLWREDGEGPDLDALRAYLRAEESVRRGRQREALVFFRQALERDSTFAWAAYGRARTADWLGLSIEARRATERAWRYREELPARERAILEGWRASLVPEPERAQEIFLAATAEFPEYDEAWLRLGEHQYHWGVLLGVPVWEAEEAFGRAHDLAPQHASPILHLLRLAVRRGDMDEVDRFSGRARELAGSEEHADEVLTLTRIARGEYFPIVRGEGELSEAVLYDLLVNTPDPTRSEQYLSIAADDDFASLPVLVAWLRRLAANGEVERMGAVYPRIERIHRTVSAEWMAEAATLPALPVDKDRIARAIESIRALPVQRSEEARAGLNLRVGEIHASRRHYFLGLLAVAAGRMAEARSQLDSLAVLPFYPEATEFRARTLAAWLALVQGDHEEALVALGPARYGYGGALPGPSSLEVGRNRYIRAAALEALGRSEEALRWYGAFPEPNGSDIPYLPAVLLGRARTLMALGHFDEARGAYSSYKAHRSGADASVREAMELIPELEGPGAR